MKSTAFSGPLADQFQATGFAVLPGLYHAGEVAALLRCLESTAASGSNFRRSRELFAIRDLLGEVPALWPLLNTPVLRTLLDALFPTGCHVVKAIYFDKPAGSNWLVPWHQDLMINVDHRPGDLPGFGPWTSKAEGVSVQPPLAVLEDVCTIRIHLDDCDGSNGALRVVPGSHRLGVVLGAAQAALTPTAELCAVPAGGAMLMRPLLLHTSSRSTSDRPRRVVHLEFSSVELPGTLQWRECHF
jgi:ectoine hydroxylase-related dioxygenase (phytanoyl-CoA dioxygenase family)